MNNLIKFDLSPIKKLIKIIDKIRKINPEIALSGDFIVGFPGETDKDFNDTIRLIKEVQYAQSYSFKYSERPGTPASVLDFQVPENEKRIRLEKLQEILFEQQAKYNSSAKTEHIIPVDLPKGKMDIVMNMAYKAHKVISCRGVTRSDFKFFNNKFYLLEINTQPGMTKLSLVPEIAAHRGMSFLELIEWIMRDASKKK